MADLVELLQGRALDFAVQPAAPTGRAVDGHSLAARAARLARWLGSRAGPDAPAIAVALNDDVGDLCAVTYAVLSCGGHLAFVDPFSLGTEEDGLEAELRFLADQGSAVLFVDPALVRGGAEGVARALERLPDLAVDTVVWAGPPEEAKTPAHVQQVRLQSLLAPSSATATGLATIRETRFEDDEARLEEDEAQLLDGGARPSLLAAFSRLSGAAHCFQLHPDLVPAYGVRPGATALLDVEIGQPLNTFLACHACLVHGASSVVFGRAEHLLAPRQASSPAPSPGATPVADQTPAVAFLSGPTTSRLCGRRSARPLQPATVVCVTPFNLMPLDVRMSSRSMDKGLPVFMPYSSLAFQQSDNEGGRCTVWGAAVEIGALDALGMPAAGPVGPKCYGQICLRGVARATDGKPALVRTGCTGYLAEDGTVCVMPYPCNMDMVALQFDAPRRAAPFAPCDRSVRTMRPQAVERRICALPDVQAAHVARGVRYLAVVIVAPRLTQASARRLLSKLPFGNFLNFALAESLPGPADELAWLARAHLNHILGCTPPLVRFLSKLHNAESFRVFEHKREGQQRLPLLHLPERVYRSEHDADDANAVATRAFATPSPAKRRAAGGMSRQQENLSSRGNGTPNGGRARSNSAQLSPLRARREAAELGAVFAQARSMEEKVRSLEQQLKEAQGAMEVASDSRKVLARQLEQARAETEEHRYWRELYERAVRRQQQELNRRESQLHQLQEARARDLQQQQQLAAVEGPRQRRRYQASPDHVEDLCKLLCAAEAEIAQSERAKEALTERCESQQQKVAALEQRLQELETRCHELQLQNDVAVDFLLRQGTPPPQEGLAPAGSLPGGAAARPASRSGNGPDEEEAAVAGGDSPSLLATPRAPPKPAGSALITPGLWRAAATVPASPAVEIDPDGVPVVVEATQLERDPEAVAGHVEFLEGVFKERGMDFPLRKLDGPNLFAVTRPELADGESELALTLAILNGRLVVEEAGPSEEDEEGEEGGELRTCLDLLHMLVL